MIDYVNYQQVEKANPKNKNYLETTLKANLSFKQEVAPNDVKEVRIRLKWKEVWGSLRKYLEDKENLSYEGLGNVPNKNVHFRGLEKDLEVKLEENLSKLKLNINITSNKDILRKDMLDLEALNTFILTGKYN